RAEAAPQTLRPGLLASVAGGAGYAGVSGEDNLDAIAAAGHYGAIAAYSFGSATTLPARASALLAGRRLVVCDLPAGAAGAAALRSRAARLRVVGPRRLKALAFLLCGWALLLLACAAGPRAWAVAWAMRAGALGVLWAPAVTLVTAALAPGAAVEYAIIALGCL